MHVFMRRIICAIEGKYLAMMCRFNSDIVRQMVLSNHYSQADIKTILDRVA